MEQELIQLERQGSVIIGHITTGHLSADRAELIVEDLRHHLRYDGCHDFILDMSEVSFVGSGCLGALITFVQDLEHVRGRLALANCQPDVAFLFKTTKLDMVIPLFEDVAEAQAEI